MVLTPSQFAAKKYKSRAEKSFGNVSSQNKILFLLSEFKIYDSFFES